MGRVHIVFAGLILVLFPNFGPAAAATVPDTHFHDFENNAVLFELTGTPYNNPVNSSVSITTDPNGVWGGQKALEFSYELNENASPALLDTRLSLVDLVSISFLIKSENEALWVVYIRDPDDAGFIAFVDLLPGQWQFVELVPEDFAAVPNSINPGKMIDPSKLDVGLTMLDARNKFAGPGSNTIQIDNFALTRSWMEYLEGDYVVDGAVDTIAVPTILNGNLIVENGARLDITASRFKVRGNVVVRGSSALNFQDGAWSFPADYWNERSFDVSGGSELTFTNGKFELPQQIEGAIDSGSRLRFDNVVRGRGRGQHWAILDGGILELEADDHIGEFVLSDNTQSTIRNSKPGVFWVACDAGFSAPVSVPDGNLIESWTAPIDWNRDITIVSSSDVHWAFLVLPNCDVQIQGSQVRAIGMAFWGGSTEVESISGLAPDVLYDDYCAASTHSSICLANSTVDTWNIYSIGTVTVDVLDSMVGEAIAFDNSQLRLTDTIVDGSGGHLGSHGQAQVDVTRGEVITKIRSYSASRMNFIDSSITGNITAVDTSQINLTNTPHSGQTITFGDATVIVE